MRIKRKWNKRSKKRVRQDKAFGSFFTQRKDADKGFDDFFRKEAVMGLFERRCLEMGLPDGTSLTAMTLKDCSEPSLDVVLCRSGQNEVVCSVRYDSHYPEAQRLRIAAYHHDCDFAVYEEPFVADEVEDEE